MSRIYEKLNQIQGQLKAPKNLRNEGGGYSFRSCESILQAVKPLLLSTNTALVLTDTVVAVGDRYYVRAVVTLHCIKDKEDRVSVDAWAREVETSLDMEPSQITGAASSYARKYALGGLFCLDDNRDADATNTHGNKQPAPQNNDPKLPGDWVALFDKECPKTVKDIQEWRDKNGGRINRSLPVETDRNKVFGYIKEIENDYMEEEEQAERLTQEEEQVTEETPGLELNI